MSDVAEFGDPRLPERFWSKVGVDAETGCWLWMAGLRNGYGSFHVFRKMCIAHRVSYGALVDGECPSMLDHVCRMRRCVNPEHLRPATCSQNSRYRESIEGSSSQFMGVSWYKSKGKWRAQIQVEGKNRFLGYFEDEEDASRAYDAAVVELGVEEFVLLNFPDDSDERRQLAVSRRCVQQLAEQQSRFRGVCWHKHTSKWQAGIKVEGKNKHLGYFEDEEEAARAFDAAAVQYGRKLNFPEECER